LGLSITATQGNEAANQTLWQLTHQDTRTSGFYTMTLTPKSSDGSASTDGGDSEGKEPATVPRRSDATVTEDVLFAVNTDPAESVLQRIDARELRRQLGDAPVQIVKGAQWIELGATDAKWEAWPLVLALLFIVLFSEQISAWLLGKRRSVDNGTGVHR
jgi:hypothetical protein